MSQNFTTRLFGEKKEKVQEVSDKWKDAEAKARRLEKLSVELEEVLNQIGPKYKEIVELIPGAYTSAPLTDCALSVSPLGPTKMMNAIRNHLRKRGVQVDKAFVGNAQTLPDFSEHMKYATTWLLKLSHLNGG